MATIVASITGLLQPKSEKPKMCTQLGRDCMYTCSDGGDIGCIVDCYEDFVECVKRSFLRPPNPSLEQ
ncbi:hypothetical protein ScPMuIL_014496 [Solemya velum]